VSTQTKIVQSKGLMTVTEIARYLSVRVGWVYKHARVGHREQIPSLRVGKYLRFRIAEIEGWLKARDKGRRRPRGNSSRG
jgi:excisionase family DNA binding protein